MDFNTLVERLKETNTQHIIVSGPQRAGTTIATQMLAQELHFRPVLEEAIGHTNIVKLASLFRNDQGIVLQAPALSSVVHLLGATVVFMRRPVAEIIASQKRISWHNEADEKAMYFDRSSDPIAEVKYRAWDTYQRAKLGVKAFDLDYHSLESHPLWVGSDERRYFNPRQTQPKQ